MSSSERAALHLAGDDLLQLVHLEPVEHAALDRLDQVARLAAGTARASRSRRTPPARAPRCRARAARVVRADGADERAGAQPLAAQHRVLRRRHRDDDVLLRRLAVRLGRLAAVLGAERREPLARCGSRRRRARSTGTAARMHAICDAACQPQPITPSARRARPSEVTRRDARTRRRSAAARACPPRSRPRAAPASSEKSSDDERRPVAQPRVRLERRRSRARGRRTPSPRTAPSSSGSRSRGRLSTTPRASRRNDSSTASRASAGVSSSATSASRRYSGTR